MESRTTSGSVDKKGPERVRLSSDRIRKYLCSPGKLQSFLWDTDAPALAVRATPNGSKSYVFEAKLNRQTIRRTIGSVDAWLLDDARAEARRLQVLIDKGLDPRELDREAAEAKAAKKSAAVAEAKAAEDAKQYTLRALCDAYVAMLEARGKTKSARGTASAFKCWISDAVATKPAADVTPEEIAKAMRKAREAGKERTAGVLRSYLLAAFTAAIRAPYDSSLPADLIGFGIKSNPVAVIPAVPVRAGNRTLSVAELKDYMARMGNDLAGQALRLALYAGGQRMAQLLRTTMADYDPDTRTLRLFDGKGRRRSEREHLLPLAPKAAAVVDDLIARAAKLESKFLFSSHGRVAMTLTTPGGRVTEISAAMKGEPFDLRDIRRTCETMLAGLGISRDVRAQLLSHGISGVQAAHYDRYTYTEEKRAALTAWEARLEEITTGKPAAGNVKRLPRRKAA
jgi:integrase